MASWIWLSDPQYQVSDYNLFYLTDKPYCMAQFEKEYVFPKKAVRATLRVSGDVRFRLFVNGTFVYGGPPAVGGDFEPGNRPFGRYFAQTLEVLPGGECCTFLAEVQQQPVRLTDMSKGHGGFYLEGTVYFADGTTQQIGTDCTWKVRRNARYVSTFCFDGGKDAGAWEDAVEIPDIWRTEDAPIPPLSYTKILPAQGETLTVPAGESLAATVLFDKIYAAHICFDYDGDCTIHAECRERPDKRSGKEDLTFCGSGSYRGFGMHSVGELALQVRNTGKTPLTLHPYIQFVCYPAPVCGDFRCSDPGLNKVYDVCRHTLKICRQSLHLDSPMHQELLACTGDYYIESLMTAMTFGDLRLAEFDILRTADILREKQGNMFHTTYSMIYVQMVYDIYMYTGNLETVRAVWDALYILLERMHSFIGETGLLENPPSFMFFDWMVREGYTMHHPPKSMGQTLLCAFYYGALRTAVKLAGLLDEPGDIYAVRADALRDAMNEKLFDKARRLYFDGTYDKSGGAEYLPVNVEGRFYSKHSNILCALYGVCPEADAADLVERVLADDTLLDMQPYFMHFALEAVSKTGLFPKYGIAMLKRWKQMTDICDKGLQEGWYKPEETYSFDYSHAWGGTPAYQLPHKLLGLEMLEPGYRKIRLHPQLFGLAWANITIPTPFGMISCTMKNGETEMVVPDGITVV